MGFVSGLCGFGRISALGRILGFGLISFLLPLFVIIKDPQSESSRILVEPHLIDAEFRKACMPFSPGLVILLLLLINSWILLVISCLRSHFWIFLELRCGICRKLLGLKRLLLEGWMGGLGTSLRHLPLPWFSGLAALLELVETSGVWPQGLLDAYIDMIPEADGDFTPLGQRPLNVLPVVYRLWASLRLGHLREWVEELLPKSVFSLGNGLSSVEAWFSAALDIQEVLSGTGGDQLHVMVADVIKSFGAVGRSILDCALGRLVSPGLLFFS